MRCWRWDEVYDPAGAFNVDRVVYSRGPGSPLHTHDFAEVVWVEGGRGIHHLNRRPIEVTPGSLWFIRPWDVHAWESSKEAPLALTNVAYRPVVAKAFARLFPQDGAPWFRWRREQAPAHATIDEDARHRLAMAAARLHEGPNRELFLVRFLLEVLAEVMPPVERKAGAKPRENEPPWLRAAVTQMQDRAQLQAGVEAFVRLAGVTADHLARVTRRVYGRPPSLLVNDWRLEVAARELRTTRRPIIDVAFDVGLDNLSYFYRRFRSRFGVAPAAYRRRHDPDRARTPREEEVERFRAGTAKRAPTT